jgi:UDP-N-acetyl-D-mannosaminuronic acid dehydrogenase
MKRAEDLFSRIAEETVRLEPEEAELAKLFTNSWRYIKFAVANQFFMIANDYGIDFDKVRTALRHNYPRATDLPGAGFAAGPCLLKDTMQLAAFNNNGFTLGHASMMINEGLPLYLISHLERNHDLSTKTVGILGMAFKPESDDRRDSLSYKLKRILRFKAAAVLCTDPYVRDDPELVPLEHVLSEADVLVVGTPHACYATFEPNVPVVDVWNVFGRGVTV